MEIKYISSVNDLVGLISDKVAELLCDQENKDVSVEKVTTVLDFATYEIPTPEEFNVASAEERKEMEEDASGWYGIAALPTPFNNTSVVFAFGYYGGCDFNVFNLPFGSTIDEIRQEVASSINLIYQEIPSPANFLVRIYN